MEKSSITGGFFMALFEYQRVYETVTKWNKYRIHNWKLISLLSNLHMEAFIWNYNCNSSLSIAVDYIHGNINPTIVQINNRCISQYLLVTYPIVRFELLIYRMKII